MPSTLDYEREKAEKFAQKIMSMNRHDRRAYAKQHGLQKIVGSNVDHIKRI